MSAAREAGVFRGIGAQTKKGIFVVTDFRRDAACQDILIVILLAGREILAKAVTLEPGNRCADPEEVRDRIGGSGTASNDYSADGPAKLTSVCRQPLGDILIAPPIVLRP